MTDLKAYENCRLCPHHCGVNRIKNELGRCHAPASCRAGAAMLHHWEEPIICSPNGSGAVFFSGCSLACVFCQNASISHENHGFEISTDELVDAYFRLEESGADNINLVSATHYIPHVSASIKKARAAGLSLAFIYNSSGFESVEALRLLDGLIDIYLPDLKYYSAKLAKRYSGAYHYPQYARAAIDEMFRQVSGFEIDPETHMMKRGMIVRLLILPGQVRDAMASLAYLHTHYRDSIFISLMRQFTPTPGLGNRFPELQRRLSDEEYEAILKLADELDLKYAFTQEAEAAAESFIPEFRGQGLIGIKKAAGNPTA
ncbi:MAG: radical SAM protein [Eubacteriales bacterium]|nr:radical SAM protein [Eubacteriales bacterium]